MEFCEICMQDRLFFLTLPPQEKAGEKCTPNTSVCKAMHTSLNFSEPKLISLVHSGLFCYHNNAEKSVQTVSLVHRKNDIFMCNRNVFLSLAVN